MSPRPRILFLCSSLEPGRDGVGDYTRALAKACLKELCAVKLVALHDRFCTRANISTASGLPELRLPSTLSWHDKTIALQAFVQPFQATHTSWQFVPYGYSPKGLLPAELLAESPLFCQGSVHFMMHELWIGAHKGASPKERFMGWLQRRALAKLLRKLKPRFVHSSNPSYCHLLAALGFKAEGLPLFGNIPVASVDSPAQEAVLRAAPSPKDTPAADNKTPATLEGLLFGTLHAQWKPEPFCAWLKATAARNSRLPRLTAAGRLGPHAPAILNTLRAQGLEVQELGEQTPEALSVLLQTHHFGLAPHPWHLIGKSGVAAAMLDHGLPVLVPREDWTPRGGWLPPEPREPLLLRLSKASPATTDAWLLQKRTPAASLPTVAKRFISDLSASLL